MKRAYNNLEVDNQVVIQSSPPTQSDPDGVTIYLYEEVNEKSINRVLGEIYKHTDKPILLRIKTMGGAVEDALALVDVIRKFNVSVHADGYVYSAGLFLFCSGSVRTAEENALFMYHDISWVSAGQSEDHETQLQYSKLLGDKVVKIITNDTLLTPEILKEYRDKKADWYFDMTTALEYDLITHKVETVTESVETDQYVDIREQRAIAEAIKESEAEEAGNGEVPKKD